MSDIFSFDEAISYLKSLDVYGSVLGLENMRELAARLDNPQDGLKFIHVTGTNGKGSVCAFLSSILSDAGYLVGTYNSPAVLSDIDQYRINMDIISEQLFAEAASLVKNACEAIVEDGGKHPTRFEVETMIAFTAFYIEGCDIVVLETGLGGRDDATNIINSTILHVITSISMDHSAILGDSLAQIAENKAGIIRSSAPVLLCTKDVLSLSDAEAKEINAANAVFINRCIKTQSNLYTIGETSVSNVSNEDGSLFFDIKEFDLSNLAISMIGAYQPLNATVSVAAARLIAEMGYDISEENIRNGLAKANIPFRFERVSKKQIIEKTGGDTQTKEKAGKGTRVDIILDGAHNPDGAKQLVKSLELVYPDREFIYIVGIFKDKDYEQIAEITAGKASKIYIIKNTLSERSLDREKLKEAFSKYNKNTYIALECESEYETSDEIEKALLLAKLYAKNTVSANATHPVIVCFGSLSWLKHAKDILKSSKTSDKKHTDSIKDDKIEQKSVKEKAIIDVKTVAKENDIIDVKAAAKENDIIDVKAATKEKAITDAKTATKEKAITDKKTVTKDKLSVKGHTREKTLDEAKIKQGIKLILEGIGEDINREGLKDTPDRVARMYEEIFSGINETAQNDLSKTFSSDAKEMVIEKDITFYSMCEHHLMPFYGKAHVAYIPDGRVVGISKLARCVETYAKKPQIQEKLTDEIADAIMKYLKPKGVIVMLEAEHMCMTMRGVKKPGTKTVTLAARGKMQKKENKDLFFELVK